MSYGKGAGVPNPAYASFLKPSAREQRRASIYPEVWDSIFHTVRKAPKDEEGAHRVDFVELMSNLDAVTKVEVIKNVPEKFTRGPWDVRAAIFVWVDPGFVEGYPGKERHVEEEGLYEKNPMIALIMGKVRSSKEDWIILRGVEVMPHPLPLLAEGEGKDPVDDGIVQTLIRHVRLSADAL